jgi:hypothetical protein
LINSSCCCIFKANPKPKQIYSSILLKSFRIKLLPGYGVLTSNLYLYLTASVNSKLLSKTKQHYTYENFLNEEVNHILLSDEFVISYLDIVQVIQKLYMHDNIEWEIFHVYSDKFE